MMLMYFADGPELSSHMGEKETVKAFLKGAMMAPTQRLMDILGGEDYLSLDKLRLLHRYMQAGPEP
jgi:hypothetical protein